MTPAALPSIYGASDPMASSQYTFEISREVSPAILVGSKLNQIFVGGEGSRMKGSINICPSPPPQGAQNANIGSAPVDAVAVLAAKLCAAAAGITGLATQRFSGQQRL